eukprot:CAMPEP_0171646722 /NCGR_PEP_ID=MMETSP0990-20121206/34963_1 /TAXON_ID=483369 /ORGANISM="non described non described, Strain CCMP2098" /LENGTH=501 /DNA_ID=CAMNT_0012223675 /DNA_START=121 /DNA_END=1628 /DNA_ORIENTATION=-
MRAHASPITELNLKPCPEHGLTSSTEPLGCRGCQSTKKCSFGVKVYRHAKLLTCCPNATSGSLALSRARISSTSPGCTSARAALRSSGFDSRCPSIPKPPCIATLMPSLAPAGGTHTPLAPNRPEAPTGRWGCRRTGLMEPSRVFAVLPFLLGPFLGGSSSSSGGETGGSSGGASKVGPQLSDFSFLGKLVALAVRHSLLVPLNLSDLAWKPLVGLPVGRRELAGADKGKADALKMVEQWREEDFEEELESSLDGLMKTFGQVTVTTTSTSSGCGGCGGPTGGGGGGGSNNEEHIGGGGGVRSSSSSSSTQEPLTFLNRKAFVAEVEAKALTATNAQLSAFFHGLSAGLPCQLFPLFTPLEFEVLVCGAPDIDVELLKKVTEYQGEGVSSEAPHVKYLWESLERMDQSQRSKFVNFVSARSKLPSSADEFPMHFKVCEPKPSAKAEPDSHLPHSQTCFFTLSLPFYSSQEVCFRKLLYAIDNATTMDDDFQNREVWGDGTS